MRNLVEFTGKYLCRNLFFNKVKLCRSATALKVSLQCRCFLENFAKFARNLFCRTPPDECFLLYDSYYTSDGWFLLYYFLLYSSINSSEGRIAKRKCKLGYKSKAYVPIWARSVSYQKRAVLVKFEQVSEAVVCRFSSKQMFLKISQISQKVFLSNS